MSDEDTQNPSDSTSETQILKDLMKKFKQHGLFYAGVNNGQK